ncbi:9332_t:CDS:2 [Acaulospora colombiana]|uniref:9332_t:CDS:1 n=1 Tax=Acaulospora colombiana TaxID=27376 RepID=A0ACA9PZA4_9GLOM|nr:9332_t:CDS:2 [Acaulospora colombiana]
MALMQTEPPMIPNAFVRARVTRRGSLYGNCAILILYQVDLFVDESVGRDTGLLKAVSVRGKGGKRGNGGVGGEGEEEKKMEQSED